MKMPFEHHHQPVAPHPVFLRRMVNHLFITLALIGFTLALGVLGYRFIAGLHWLDALLESSMLMGGEGPIFSANLPSPAAKIFASGYALFCGLVLIAGSGILLAPVVHRILHRLHVRRELP
jgi:hypothetical protein